MGQDFSYNRAVSTKKNSPHKSGGEGFFAQANDSARKQNNAELTTVEAAKLLGSSRRKILDDLAKAEFEEGTYDRLPEQ